MSVSTHVYQAVLKGSPDRALSLVGGSISLDASRRPHVSGSITIAVPSLATLAALDPRMSPAPRIVVTADATFPWGTQTRSFNLGLRDRTVNLAAGTVTLPLASDEALLADKGPLEDDITPLNYQASLRGLVGYVLDKVIPGATLAAGADVPVPALAESSNLIRNPRVAVGITDWLTTWTSGGLTPTRQASGGPSYAPTYLAVQASAATVGGYIYLSEASLAVTPGKLYELSVDVGANAGINVQVDAILYDAAGNIVNFATPTAITPGASWKRIATTFVAVGNTVKVRPRVFINGTMPASQYVNVTAWRLSESTGDRAADRLYFDGGFTDTAQYDYGWAQTAHASISTRKPLIASATPDALTWRAGKDAMSFLSPLVQAAGLRLVCDEQRVWTLRSEGYDAGGALEVRHGVNLIDGSERISRDDREWFDAAVVVYTWTDRNGIRQERTDYYALSPSYTLLRRFEFSTPFPGPGFAEYAVRRAQGRGRQVTVKTVADWNAKAEQGITVVLEGAPTQTGETSVVTFDFDTDEVTLTSRTIDTPPGAWVLLAAGQKWTDSPVGGSWIGEAV
ncbi:MULTISPECIES: hypothetical protein [unclassified Microbacterium]|uniref:hypothetical protein n=1 Tax=unclassified Microbacterium TaxID=2609290 RepID=UPI00343DF1F2